MGGGSTTVSHSLWRLDARVPRSSDAVIQQLCSRTLVAHGAPLYRARRIGPQTPRALFGNVSYALRRDCLRPHARLSLSSFFGAVRYCVQRQQLETL